MVTGVEKLACCQPDAVSPVNGILPSRAPAGPHRWPTWVRRGLTRFRRQICAPKLAPTVERLALREFSVCRQGNDSLVRLSVGIVSSRLTSGHLYLSQRASLGPGLADFLVVNRLY